VTVSPVDRRPGRTGASIAALTIVLLVMLLLGPIAAIATAAAGTGSITGEVTNAGTGQRLASICVSAHPTSGGAPLSRNRTGGHGLYSLNGLPAGTYAVRFSGCGSASDYVAQYYNDEQLLASANPVSVTAGATTAGIGAAMVQGGSISGTVTEVAKPPKPLADVCVAAVIDDVGGGPKQATPPSSADAADATTTAADGIYTFAALAEDTYQLNFTDCHHHRYLAEMYTGTVTVSPGSVSTGIDVSMQLPGRISGTVTSNSTQSVCVSGGDSSATVSPGDSYVLRGLYPGRYAVLFGSCQPSTYVYVQQYYKDQAKRPDYVKVKESATTPDIDAAMILGGDITGTVTNENECANVEVEAVSTSGGHNGIDDFNTNSTDTFTISGLFGLYNVFFYYGTNTTQRVRYKRNPVDVASGVTTSGVNRTIPSGGC
jgi:hypothetical protein